jgi:hypothetical protein
MTELVRVSRYAMYLPRVSWFGYKDLLSRVQKPQPELASEVRQALASVREYHDWLVANRPGLNIRALSASRSTTGSLSMSGSCHLLRLICAR